MVVVYILMVVVGLGLIIFVHELGHFLVAKLCGVKCEKFYLGFDIFGAKLWKRRWGETEYGIGALPLGGYVKMLGQEDNPARLREELKRAKARQAAVARYMCAASCGAGVAPARATEANAQAAGTAAPQSADAEEPIDIAAVEQALNDPRSYLCQSVPRRMAIISAGVIMNVIFAFVAAVIAFEVGVKQQPCEVGGVVPGEAAWKAGIRVGDRIRMVAGEKVYQFGGPAATDRAGRRANGDPRGHRSAGRRPGRVPPDDRPDPTGADHRHRFSVAPGAWREEAGRSRLGGRPGHAQVPGRRPYRRRSATSPSGTTPISPGNWRSTRTIHCG